MKKNIGKDYISFLRGEKMIFNDYSEFYDFLKNKSEEKTIENKIYNLLELFFMLKKECLYDFFTTKSFRPNIMRKKIVFKITDNIKLRISDNPNSYVVRISENKILSCIFEFDSKIFYFVLYIDKIDDNERNVPYESEKENFYKNYESILKGVLNIE